MIIEWLIGVFLTFCVATFLVWHDKKKCQATALPAWLTISFTVSFGLLLASSLQLYKSTLDQFYFEFFRWTAALSFTIFCPLLGLALEKGKGWRAKPPSNVKPPQTRQP